MKFIKKAPLLMMLAITGVLFTAVAWIGRNDLYGEQESNLLKEPLLSVVFSGWKEEIYPWQVTERFWQSGNGQHKEETNKEVQNLIEENNTDTSKGQENFPEEIPEAAQMPVADEEKVSAPAEEKTPLLTETAKPEVNVAVMPSAMPTPYPIQNMRLEPLRESTHEEYLNHISADIYGDAGVLRAAEYPFVQVEDDYFDDALFIGDSRTVGLHDYTDLRERAVFLCETSLTIHKVFDREFKGMGTLEEVLHKEDFGKIYLMVGINELGLGTTEDYMAKYTEVVDRIHELEPEALIFVQGTMRVSAKKSLEDDIFNNQNINARNNAIATLADNIQVFYIDVNEVVCDEEGNLSEEYTFDQIHLLGVYNDLWKQFLLTRGVVNE